MTTATRISSAWQRLLKSPDKAGGIVVRPRRATHEMLLVSSVTRPGRWTLPKGTIEHGEHPVATAIREIAEEAGVSARVVRSLGVVNRDGMAIKFFLLRFSHDVAWPEDGLRERRWVDVDKAERYLRQADLHGIIAAARRILEPR